MDLELLEANLEKQRRREELETIAADVLGEIIENIVGKVEAIERENTSFIRQLIMEEIVDKVGDRMKEDFKNFIIEELFKRITSTDHFDSDYGYGDVMFEDNVSDLFMKSYNDAMDAEQEIEDRQQID